MGNRSTCGKLCLKFLTGVVVRVRHQEHFQRLLVPLVALVTDLKALFPGAAVGVIKRQQVVNIQQLRNKKKTFPMTSDTSHTRSYCPLVTLQNSCKNTTNIVI